MIYHAIIDEAFRFGHDPPLLCWHVPDSPSRILAFVARHRQGVGFATDLL
jgi:hypothetical protein